MFLGTRTIYARRTTRWYRLRGPPTSSLAAIQKVSQIQRNLDILVCSYIRLSFADLLLTRGGQRSGWVQ